MPQMNNQMPVLPPQPRTPEGIAMIVGRFVLAFVRIALWTVLTLLTLAFVYVSIRGIFFAVSAICKALGV